MKLPHLKIVKYRDAVSIKTAVAAALFMTVILAIGTATGFLQRLHTAIGLPVDFKMRELLQVTPPVSPKLKIIILDDSTYAYIRQPYLTGEDWSKLLQAVGSAQPRVIITSHMFGTGEFDIGQGILSKTLRELQLQGTDIITGSFASPLKISFRKPLALDRPEFQISKLHTPMSELPGWMIYGPDAEHAGDISGIGHLGYDGIGRIASYLKVSEKLAVPHISVVTSRILESEMLPITDGEGRFLVNFPDLSQLQKNTKSMKFLLGPDGHNWAQKAVSQGDTVLILADMYTGKANFSNTPIGSLPSGYIVAATINSAMTDLWIADRSNSFFIIAIFLFLGITCGTAPSLKRFLLSFSVGSALIPSLGVLSFAVMGVVFPWTSSLLFYSLAAASVFFKQTHARLMHTKERNAKMEKESEKLNAIVRTAQMFAHDVRKPFSMLNMTAQSIQKLTDTGQITKFMNRMLPELERSMSSVEGMIKDVMEIDSMGSICTEQAGVEDLIGECMREVFLLRETPVIDLEYRFDHSMMIDIDRSKIKRVIVNIMENALQAMNHRNDQRPGKIWISSCDVFENGTSWVELTIGNTNSYIEPENLPRIFEAFYTKGKKGGTGLGLAIAQKVILEHGGRIAAHSDITDGTDFCFSLPAAYATPQSTIERPLPTKSTAFSGFLPSGSTMLTEEDQENLHSQALSKLNNAKNRLGRGIKILVIDDELVYLESMKAILSGGVFANLVVSETANSSEQALDKAQTFEPDLVLCDIDMGPNSISGFDLVEQLRKDDIEAYIVMHSNRIFQLDSSRAAAVGANHFLPKPINEIKLMTVITEGLKGAENRGALKKDVASAPSYRDMVVVVDDDVFTLEAWEAILDDADVKTFENPAAFWQYLAANKSFINDIKLIVTDYYFDNDAEENGESFARRIKQIGKIPVVLSSNGSFTEVSDVFDAVIGKEPDTYIAIKTKLNKAG